MSNKWNWKDVQCPINETGKMVIVYKKIPNTKMVPKALRT